VRSSLQKLLVLCLTLLSAAAFAASTPFPRWVEALKKEARGQGISEKTLAVLDGLEPIPRVIELDRRQPEGTMTFEQYRDRVVTPGRIENGRRLYAEHRALLTEVADRYGVDPHFLVALWGVETHYGTVMGDFSIVGALATLAYDGRRPKLFRKQLLDALKILDKGYIEPERMKGSWAGAMGNCQFMPTTFLAYAVDHDGDGRRDLWGSLPDVFASSANYLKKSGWKRGVPWGFEVKLPEGFDEALLGRDTKKPAAGWRSLGITRADGAALAESKLPMSLVRPGRSSQKVYLVQGNYHVLLRWNRSEYFASVVSLLADAIVAPEPVASEER
jgi:membrane-bound lytic murein transglycosylase B